MILWSVLRIIAKQFWDKPEYKTPHQYFYSVKLNMDTNYAGNLKQMFMEQEDKGKFRTHQNTSHTDTGKNN